MDKLSVARTLNDLNPHLPKGRGDCFDYGSWNGCDKDCPQLLRGECEVVEDVLEIISKDDCNELIEEFIDNGYYKENNIQNLIKED